jgi:hypothetical protein
MKKFTLTFAIMVSIFSSSTHVDLNNVYVEGALEQAKIESSSDSTTDTSISLLGSYQVFTKGPLSSGAELGYNQYLSMDTETPFGTTASTISSLSLGGKVGYEVTKQVTVSTQYKFA